VVIQTLSREHTRVASLTVNPMGKRQSLVTLAIFQWKIDYATFMDAVGQSSLCSGTDHREVAVD